MPIKKIVRALGRAVKSLDRASRIESCDIFGHRFELRAGTFRWTPDYDDAWFLACALHSSDVFDIGANVGYDAVLSLACTNLTGTLANTETQRIALIEANPKALAIAAENLIRNNLSLNARFVPAFASDTPHKEVTFWTSGSGAAGSMSPTHASTAASRGDSIQVPTTTVDALCDRLDASPDFVKIDVEGAEALVLTGSTRLAALQKTRFLVEMHANPDLSMVINTQRVLDWCGQVGYTAWYLKEQTLLATPEPIAHRGRCHLLLQPSQWTYPEWLDGIAQSAPLQEALDRSMHGAVTPTTN